MGGSGAWGRSAGCRVGALAFLAFSCFAALPSASDAALVWYTEAVGPPINVLDSGSETNSITLNGEEAPTLSLFRDDTAPLRILPDTSTDRAHCTVLGLGHRAACWTERTSVGGVWFSADLGGGDDYVRVLGDAPSQLFGREGDDVMVGGDGPDNLYGDAGADEFYGGGGFDYAYHWISPDPPAVGVSISLDDVANDGVPGEGDNVHSDIESVGATQYADTLIGNDSANWLDGGGGDDRIEGGPGDDHLSGSAGSDSISAGAGDDTVDAVYWAGVDPDVVDCGPGTDTVTAEPEDQLIDCENVTFD
jgi:Ca2+-binding RTX toxin-like protein